MTDNDIVPSYQNLAAIDADTLQAAIVAGIEIAGPQAMGEASGRFFTQVVPQGATFHTIDLESLEADLEKRLEPLQPHPRRKQGTVFVQDADSFVRYIGKHRLPSTEVFADYSRMKLVGVINANEESTPDEAAENKAGHGDHRVVLELMATDEWKAWIGHDNKLLEQMVFATHLEDHVANIVDPDAATMLEIAQSFHATMSADFKSAQRINSGEVGFRFEEQNNARAGEMGELEIPTDFVVELAPFEGCERSRITARFRYRIQGGNLLLGYALLDPQGVARQAFLDHVQTVRDLIVPPVFQGRPE